VSLPNLIPAAKKRVLFVCVGNSCRSQMAEAFARLYGNDVIIAASAGISPAYSVAPDTMRAMREKNLDLRDHFPKSLRHSPSNPAHFPTSSRSGGQNPPPRQEATLFFPSPYSSV